MPQNYPSKYLSKREVLSTAKVVRSVDKRWNSLYPDILHLVQGLERLGVEYHNGEVSYTGLEGCNV